MKSPIRFLLPCSVALLLGGCSMMKPSPKNEDLVSEARAVDQQFEDAFGRGDVDALMASYAKGPDTVLYPPDEIAIKGWDEIRAYAARLFREHPGVKLQLTETNYRVEGSTVLGSGMWKMLMPDANGRVSPVLGRYSEVFVRREGKLVVVVDHASAPLPAPTESANSKSKRSKPRGRQRSA